MNILWSIHLYYPRHGAGAESMARTINKYLISKGHTVKILLNQANEYKITEMYSFEDVDVFPPDEYTTDRLFRWADVVISHLDYNKWTSWQCAKYGKRLIHVVHNDIPYPSVIDCPCPVKVVYNSQWVKDALNYDKESFVFPPPVDRSMIVENREKKYIAMVNLNINKGVSQFYSIAKRLPQYQFLAIKGSYDGQIETTLPNVTTVPNVPDIRVYYKDVAVMLCLSHYESWGLVASEAMMNGIPLICNPTPGLLENVGKGGMFIDRKDFDKIAGEIKKLMEDEKYYSRWAKAGLKRSEEQKSNFEGLEKFILS
jgi:glycosyltransferase involved in cell wall biosynthesis